MDWHSEIGLSEVYMAGYPDTKLKEFAKIWLNGPLPADLIADLADILEDEDYTPEKRAHHIVWQALKWGLENGQDWNSDRQG